MSIAKRESIAQYNKDGIDINYLNIDSPIAFNLNKLWYNLYIETLGKFYPKKDGAVKDKLAFEIDNNGNELIGDFLEAIPPVFKMINTNSTNW